MVTFKFEPERIKEELNVTRAHRGLEFKEQDRVYLRLSKLPEMKIRKAVTS